MLIFIISVIRIFCELFAKLCFSPKVCNSYFRSILVLISIFSYIYEVQDPVNGKFISRPLKTTWNSMKQGFESSQRLHFPLKVVFAILWTDFLMTIFAHARVKFYFEFGNEDTCVW